MDETYVKVNGVWQEVTVPGRRLLSDDGDRPDVFYVTGIESDVIGGRLLEGGVELHELTPLQESLEGIFMGLTQDAVQYQSHDARLSTPERRAA